MFVKFSQLPRAPSLAQQNIQIQDFGQRPHIRHHKASDAFSWAILSKDPASRTAKPLMPFLGLFSALTLAQENMQIQDFSQRHYITYRKANRP